MKTVAVFGASGFIGTTFVEQLLARGDCEVKPFIHSGRNAWRLARLGLSLQQVDVLDQKNLERAISGCTHVVNSIMGPRVVMFDGLKNLLAASQKVEVQRFVHLSSITAYGEPPLPESVVENAKPQPRRGTYGWIKMTQDQLVSDFVGRGLSSAVLCPPLVSGPRSTQLIWLLKTINENRFAQIESGEAPCAVVDVENLAHAMMLALDSPDPGDQRIFILDDMVPNWADLIQELEPVFEPGVDIPIISVEEAKQYINYREKLSPIRTAKFLTSPQVRQVLNRDPLIRSVGNMAPRVYARAGCPPRNPSPVRAVTALPILLRPHSLSRPWRCN